MNQTTTWCRYKWGWQLVSCFGNCSNETLFLHSAIQTHLSKILAIMLVTTVLRLVAVFKLNREGARCHPKPCLHSKEDPQVTTGSQRSTAKAFQGTRWNFPAGSSQPPYCQHPTAVTRILRDAFLKPGQCFRFMSFHHTLVFNQACCYSRAGKPDEAQAVTYCSWLPSFHLDRGVWVPCALQVLQLSVVPVRKESNISL